MDKTALIPPTPADLLATELAKMRLCAGNEAKGYAERILKFIHESEKKEMSDLINHEEVDLDELVKNDKAIMEGIVSMSKMVTAMDDRIKRHYGEEKPNANT